MFAFIEDANLQNDWQKCTNKMCPMLTNCILDCDSKDCKMECIENFELEHQNCPCEVNKYCELVYHIHLNRFRVIVLMVVPVRATIVTNRKLSSPFLKLRMLFVSKKINKLAQLKSILTIGKFRLKSI